MTKSAASPVSSNGFTVYKRLRRRARLERDEVAGSVELEQRVGEAVAGAEQRRRHPVGRQLAPRREQQVDECRRDRAEHGQQRPLEPAADPRKVDEDDGEHHRGGLRENVAAAHVGELVRDHGLELRRRQRTEQAGRERDARSRRGRGRPTSARG